MVMYVRYEIKDIVYDDVINGKVAGAVGEDNSSSSFNLTFSNVNGVYSSIFNISNEVGIWIDNEPILDSDDATKIFTGFVEDIKKKGRTGHERITLSGRDYTASLQDITIPPVVYNNQDVSLIIEDIMNNNVTDVTYSQSTYGFTIDRISFNHTSVFDALRQLAERANATFYVDVNKALIFRERGSSSSGLTFDNTNVVKANWNVTRKQIVNQVWVYGARTLSGYSESFTGDGAGSVFTLGYKPHSLNMQVSGAQQIGGVYEMTQTAQSGTNYLVDYDNKNAIFVSGTDIGYTSIPGSLVNVSASYDRELPLVRRGRDLPSINAYKLKEKIIQDDNIKSIAEVNAVITANLEPNPFTKGTLNVESVDAIYAGQTCIVNFTNDGIVNEVYEMLNVTYNLTPKNLLSDDVISIVVNKKIPDVTDTIKDLMQDIKALQTPNVEDTDILTRVEFGAGSYGFRMTNWTINSLLVGSDFYVGSPAHSNGWVGSPGSFWVGSHSPYISGLISGGTW